MDDAFLIRQVLGGNRGAFHLLVVRYQRPIFRFLGGMGLEAAAVEELAQESFLRAFRNLGSYDAGKATFSAWLFTIARNLALNEIARSRRRAPHVAWQEQALGADVGEPRPSAQEALEIAERRRRVRLAIGRLPDLLRGVLVLAYMKELSIEDIAAVECCSVGTVKSRLFRGKKLLREALAQSED
jgi:RNA polymerase sigma-70 factor (ECF subfamily)